MGQSFLTEKQCEIYALENEYPYGDYENNANYPPGCYLYSWFGMTDTVYYNDYFNENDCSEGPCVCKNDGDWVAGTHNVCVCVCFRPRCERIFPKIYPPLSQFGDVCSRLMLTSDFFF